MIPTSPRNKATVYKNFVLCIKKNLTKLKDILG